MKINKLIISILSITLLTFSIKPNVVHAETGTRLNDDRISEEDLLSITKSVGEIYNINPYLLFALTETESSRFIYCINYNGTCFGLTQISTYWHSDRMERLGITDIYDPYSNLLCCADYISELYSIYNTTESVLMHYNMITSVADEMVANGQVSNYARTIIDRTTELENFYNEKNIKFSPSPQMEQEIMLLNEEPQENNKEISYNEAKLIVCFASNNTVQMKMPVVLDDNIDTFASNKISFKDIHIYDIFKNKSIFDIINLII